jgi:hypothetical protein
MDIGQVVLKPQDARPAVIHAGLDQVDQVLGLAVLGRRVRSDLAERRRSGLASEDERRSLPDCSGTAARPS